MKKIRILSVLFLTLVSVSLMSGCSAYQPDKAIDIIEENIPNAKVIKYEEISEDGDTKKAGYKYYCTNNDFEFTINDYTSTWVLAPIPVHQTTSTYTSSLLKYLDEELVSLEKGHNFSHDGTRFTLKINQLSDIYEAHGFMEKVFDIIDEYIPEKQTSVTESSISFRIKTEETSPGFFKEHEFTLNREDIAKMYPFGEDTLLEWDIDNYYDDVREGNVKDDSADFGNYKTRKTLKIGNIYVDGKKLDDFNDYYSEKLSIVYNSLDDKYYIPVGFGNSESYEGMERLIIEASSISNYESDSRHNVSTYYVGTKKYTIKQNYKGVVVKGTFTNREIPSYDVINHVYSPVYSIRFISLDDFCEITGLKIDKLEYDSTAAVYFVGK